MKYFRAISMAVSGLLKMPCHYIRERIDLVDTPVSTDIDALAASDSARRRLFKVRPFRSNRHLRIRCANRCGRGFSEPLFESALGYFWKRDRAGSLYRLYRVAP